MVDQRRSSGGPERPDDRYTPENAIIDPQSALIRSKIAPDLLEEIVRQPRPPGPFDVIIECNELFPGGASTAREIIIALLEGQSSKTIQQLVSEVGRHLQGAAETAKLSETAADMFRGMRVQAIKSRLTPTYVFASLSIEAIGGLSALQLRVTDPQTEDVSAIPLVHRIWLDHALKRFVYKSVQTIKADAAINAFDCRGDDIVWAVADTGIDGQHPHFQRHETLKLPPGIRHRDFTRLDELGGDEDKLEASALIDEAGHGTHVAGIIAGETIVGEPSASLTAAVTVKKIIIQQDVRVSDDQVTSIEDTSVTRISGVASKCKLVSLKVLRGTTAGNVSDVLAAIGYIQDVNDHGRRIRIHGINLSVGYNFDPMWFAPGQSALCVEVNRLVRSGVVVVVACGNSGYGRIVTSSARSDQAAFLCSISDPGNAEFAITVGSTHRDMPHTYGVSYFSGKGPTADGRNKPDLVAPGERIVSCAANAQRAGAAVFKEDSGTSMAAPHVSGAVAAFLSVRREFIGQPERVKETIVNSATDLRRRHEFQGSGGLDLMRALQSV